MKTINVYKFNELSEDAKEKAIENYRENMDSFDFHGVSEIVDTAKTVEDFFPIRIHDYSFDYYCIGSSYVKFSIDSELEEMTGVRLWKWLNNQQWVQKYGKQRIIDFQTFLGGNCPMTGVCYDEDFLDVFREFQKNPCKYTTLYDLIYEGFKNLIQSVVKEVEYNMSDEAIIETLITNEYDFFESGEMH